MNSSDIIIHTAG